MPRSDYQTIVIEWCGPVSADLIADWGEGGLYICTGRQKYQRQDHIQYIGITERHFHRRFREHHKLRLVKHNPRYWLGKIKHPGRLGRVGLERAESMLIYVIDPKLNQRKKVWLPRPTAVISHWFNEHRVPRYNRQGIFAGFPDVISWDGDNWREGNLRVWDSV
jgi:hypothetical protein